MREAKLCDANHSDDLYWPAPMRDGTSPTASPLGTQFGDGFDLRKFSDVMPSLREGTDWFPPHGAPDYSGRTVQSILLRFGFSEVAPHPDLADGTEKALETLVSNYQDYVDLAFGK